MLKTYNPGTNVYNADHEKLGTIDRVVIDPQTDEVTHLVVRKGFFFKVDKVIPIGLVENSTQDEVILQARIADLEVLPDFEAVHYVEADDPEAVAAETDSRKAVYWYPSLMAEGNLTLFPAFYNMPLPQVEIRERNIPEGTVALKKNASVISKDGKHMGKVNQIHINPNTQQVIFFLISPGGFLKEDKLVPAWWVESASEDEVHLAVNSTIFERLPMVEGQTGYRSAEI